jgi:hypothetical protein
VTRRLFLALSALVLVCRGARREEHPPTGPEPETEPEWESSGWELISVGVPVRDGASR